jgi:uncharacterized LabA/DUF88 family protein
MAPNSSNPALGVVVSGQKSEMNYEIGTLTSIRDDVWEEENRRSRYHGRDPSRLTVASLEKYMASANETISMALFCDFENVALGVRDAKFEKFDIKLVLERLLLKGSIVVKKAYCDWERYKSFKGTMHEANFELIEIPHVRQSGKNSADIRLVVDALDLCYTKSHVNTFVIISGDSDFSDRELRRIHFLRRPGTRESADRRETRNRTSGAAANGRRQTHAERRKTPKGRPRIAPDQSRGNRRADLRCARIGARRQRQDLGLGAEKCHQAAQARLQRNLLRVSCVR